MAKFYTYDQSLPVVDSNLHGPLSMDRFYICKRRLGINEELLPLVRREFRSQRYEPYKGHETQRPRDEQPEKKRNELTVQRTAEVMAKFEESEEIYLLNLKKEQEEYFKDVNHWWETKADPDNEIADNHYYDLVRLFNENLHQRYWYKEDWFHLWDHAISKNGYSPTEW